MFKLALDAGHGKNTPGKRCLKKIDPNETREWVLNARICDYIMEYLSEYQDIEIKRVDDVTGNTDVSLGTRVDTANKWGANFYLSVHHDAGINGGAGGGATVYVYEKPSVRALSGQAVILNHFKTSVGQFGNRSNETPRANLYVLRKTSMPAVLIECGFMDSAIDTPMILTEEFAKKAAKGLADAIVEIGGVTKKATCSYRKEGTTHIIECDPLSLGAYIADQIGTCIDIANFVNGGYFMLQANGKTFPLHHLVDCGNVLSNYATHGKPVTTLCVFYDGVVQMKKVLDISKEKGLKFAISGASLDDYKAEGFVGKFLDIICSTNRTYIGYRKKDNKIVICVRPATSIARAKKTFENLGVDMGMTLDGGGSTCMRVGGVWKMKTTRQINSIVMWE